MFGGLCIIELSWHVYELGKLVFVLFLMGAFVLPRTRWPVQSMWIFVGLLGCSLTIITQGANVTDNLNQTTRFFPLVTKGINNIFQTLVHRRILDLPILPIAGLVVLPWIKKDRWFLWGAFLMQWVLLIVLASRGIYEMRPRRFVLIDFYSLVALCAFARDRLFPEDAHKIWRCMGVVILCVLLAGCVWQYTDLWLFTRTPVIEKNRCLPFTESIPDYYINPARIKCMSVIADDVRKGHKVVLIYNYAAYPENNADPTCLLERLYLDLGHDQFVRSVFVFGSYVSRYSTVPMFPMSSIRSVLSSRVEPEVLNSSDKPVIVYQYLSVNEDDLFRRELQDIMDELTTRFELVSSSSECPNYFLKFFITGLRDRVMCRDNIFPDGISATYYHSSNFQGPSIAFQPPQRDIDFIWVDKLTTEMQWRGNYYRKPWDSPFSLRIQARMVLPETGLYAMQLGSDDGSRLFLDGQPRLENLGTHAYTIRSVVCQLAGGGHSLAIEYYDVGGNARLLWTIKRIDSVQM